MKSNFFLFIGLLILFLSADILHAQKLIAYPDIPGRTPCDEFVCRVRQIGMEEWKDAFVLQTISKPEVKDANGAVFNNKWLGSLKDGDFLVNKH